MVWWERELTVEPANPDDAHRPLDKSHNLAASLSHVETRQVRNDYTFRLDSELYQIEPQAVVSGLRGANVRVERRLDGAVAVRYGEKYLSVKQCAPAEKKAPVPIPAGGTAAKRRQPRRGCLAGIRPPVLQGPRDHDPRPRSGPTDHLDRRRSPAAHAGVTVAAGNPGSPVSGGGSATACPPIIGSRPARTGSHIRARRGRSPAPRPLPSRAQPPSQLSLASYPSCLRSSRDRWRRYRDVFLRI